MNQEKALCCVVTGRSHFVSPWWLHILFYHHLDTPLGIINIFCRIWCVSEGDYCFTYYCLPQCKNIKDLLIHATLTSVACNVPGNFQYEVRRYKTYSILKTTDTFASTVTGEWFTMCLLQNIKRCLSHSVQEVWPSVGGRDRSAVSLLDEWPLLWYFTP